MKDLSITRLEQINMSEKLPRAFTVVRSRCEIERRGNIAARQRASERASTVLEMTEHLAFLILLLLSERFTNNAKFCIVFLFLSLPSASVVLSAVAVAVVPSIVMPRASNASKASAAVQGLQPLLQSLRCKRTSSGERERDGAILGLPPLPSPTLTKLCRCF